MSTSISWVPLWHQWATFQHDLTLLKGNMKRLGRLDHVVGSIGQNIQELANNRWLTLAQNFADEVIEVPARRNVGACHTCHVKKDGYKCKYSKQRVHESIRENIVGS